MPGFVLNTTIDPDAAELLVTTRPPQPGCMPHLRRDRPVQGPPRRRCVMWPPRAVTTCSPPATTTGWPTSGLSRWIHYRAYATAVGTHLGRATLGGAAVSGASPVADEITTDTTLVEPR